MKIIFSFNEFLNRLLIAGISNSVAHSMLVMQDRYNLNLGLIHQLNYPQEGYPNFDDGMDVLKDEFGSVTYDPFLLKKLFVKKCNISKEIAALFSKVEEEYMIELGMI